MLKQLIIISSLLLFACTKSNAGFVINYVQPSETDDKTICEESGGIWQMLKDGCGDKCYRYEQQNTICTMAFKAGCNCGENQCLDNETKMCRTIIENSEEPEIE